MNSRVHNTYRNNPQAKKKKKTKLRTKQENRRTRAANSGRTWGEDWWQTQNRRRETEQQGQRLNRWAGKTQRGGKCQWGRCRAGVEGKKTGGKRGERHHENTEDTQTRTLEWQEHDTDLTCMKVHSCSEKSKLPAGWTVKYSGLLSFFLSFFFFFLFTLLYCTWILSLVFPTWSWRRLK